jgi:hypothetical protein
MPSICALVRSFSSAVMTVTVPLVTICWLVSLACCVLASSSSARGPSCVTPVHVAQRDDVLRCHVDEVGAALTADADAGDVQSIAWRREALPQHVPRDDGESRAGEADLGNERAPRELGHYCTSRMRMLRKPSEPA